MSDPVATLGAFHDSEDPSALTETLGLEPTSRRGSGHGASPGRNAWFLEVGHPEGEQQLSGALRSLFLTLDEKAISIADAGARGWEFEVTCFAQVPPHQSLEIEPHEAALLVKLNVRLRLFVA